MIGQDRTKVIHFTSASRAGFTGSIQKIYAPQGASLERITFGYWRRKGTGVESEAIITDTYTGGSSDPLILEKNATLVGPIIDFIISGSLPDTPGVLVYSNNVTL